MDIVGNSGDLDRYMFLILCVQQLFIPSPRVEMKLEIGFNVHIQSELLQVALHQIKGLPGQSSRCSVKFIRSKCDEGCDWCIYVTVVTCADTLTSTLCIH